jgi:hypothetical protein
MKTIVISIPAMGKTTLVKKARNSCWSTGSGVDFDLKGLNSYDPSLRTSCTHMCNDMFAAGKQFITAFNGCIDFNVLSQDVEVFFVAPATSQAMQCALSRSFNRKDSFAFIDSYYDHIIEWSYGLYKAYEVARDIIGGSRCHFVGIKGGHTLSDVFAIREDGSLNFNWRDERYSHVSHYDNKIQPGITQVDIANPVQAQWARFSSHLVSDRDISRDEFIALWTRLPESYRYSYFTYSRHENIKIHVVSDEDEAVAKCKEYLDSTMESIHNEEPCEGNFWYEYDFTSVSNIRGDHHVKMLTICKEWVSECGESFEDTSWIREDWAYWVCL